MAIKPRHVLNCRAIICGVTAMLIAGVAAIADGYAQDASQDAKVKAGLAVWKTAGCPDCHGPFADGDKQVDEAPTGANLRTTRLDTDILTETIRCGRPGAGMPAFDADAYEKHGCYGAPAGDPPDGLDPPPRTLSPAEIADVVTYLKARIIGRRAVTPEECAFYYEDEASTACKTGQ